MEVMSRRWTGLWGNGSRSELAEESGAKGERVRDGGGPGLGPGERRGLDERWDVGVRRVELLR